MGDAKLKTQAAGFKEKVLERAETLFAKKRVSKTNGGPKDRDRSDSETGQLKAELD